ncbi:para-nitrobenzyl esterase [Nonomuraea thailandensis]|uniref:Carboxylic ester hydrolase n=1 Tax=Nonomuraea thailandensis TaxID=1188745 RepID=A0A9X2K2L0_9ACTN|nr:carboxylesterase/lipase family protein [Nonomuraea thailandensis]MCP2358492.1 para-nitrobenzyl esterase [Nonomuraea thailandensis]
MTGKDKLTAGLTALGVAGALLSPSAAAADSEALVRTDRGPVRGILAEDHRSFLGIPYAAPPVGELRWRAPRPAPAWTQPRQATTPGPMCAQTGDHLGAGSTSEDCLYLNVTTPRTRAEQKLPVMVWLHGGSFKDGAGHLYDARRLAVQGNVIVVSVNYRLGAFGFLAHPALRDTDGLSGNYGLADQQAALRWVRRNAAAFGGDPRNVTLFGESSGAIAVCAHLAAPGSAGLFHRAILQSAPCTAPWSPSLAMASNPRPLAQAERDGRALAKRLGLGDSATARQLRAVPADKLLQAASDVAQPGFGPAVGGAFLPLDPARAVATGRFARVPVLYGINRHEERMHVWGLEMAKYQGPIPADRYDEEVRAAFGANADKILARYPLSAYASPSQALASALTDAEYARPALDTGKALSRHTRAYAYEFADPAAPWFAAFPKPYDMGAYHAADLPYLFDVGYNQPLTDPQRHLADHVIGYWTRFARTGDPNGSGAPAWHPFTTARPHVQSLAPGDDGIKPADFARDHRYDFWTSLNS